jgi:hypothetical protein
MSGSTSTRSPRPCTARIAFRGTLCTKAGAPAGRDCSRPVGTWDRRSARLHLRRRPAESQVVVRRSAARGIPCGLWAAAAARRRARTGKRRSCRGKAGPWSILAICRFSVRVGRG